MTPQLPPMGQPPAPQGPLGGITTAGMPIGNNQLLPPQMALLLRALMGKRK